VKKDHTLHCLIQYKTTPQMIVNKLYNISTVQINLANNVKNSDWVNFERLE